METTKFSLKLPTFIFRLLLTCGFGLQLIGSEQTISVSEVNLSFKPDTLASEELVPPSLAEENLFRLSVSEDGFFVPVDQEGALEVIEFTLAGPPEGAFSFDAIRDLQNQVVEALSDEGLYGIVVMADPEQIDPYSGEDLREGNTALNLNVWLNVVSEQRTIAKGDRLKKDEPLNHRKHAAILRNSPVEVSLAPETDTSGDESEVIALINKPKLDNYLERLNRHPRRRVDVALSTGNAPGTVVLDYLVSEPKPWIVYAQVSNTGTESTDEWRQRIGVAHYQLTGNDDILTLDFLTSSFDGTYAYAGTYEIPVVKPDYLKAKVYGSFSTFDAENLVVDNVDNFTGDTITYGGDLKYTPFYFWDHSFSLFAGARYEDIEAENVLGAGTGEATLLSPYFGIEVFKNKQVHRSRFSLIYEFNTDTSNGDIELTSLGRLGTDDDYQLAIFDFQQSFFLEPLFPGYTTPNPDKWYANSLVHELAFSVRGQYVFDDVRLIPQKQIFGGGFFSVRGYDESIARGDSGVIASAEYRLHLARLLKPSSLLDVDPDEPIKDPSSRSGFNYRAPSLYGLPDWNLLARGFFDYATFEVSDIRPDEVEQDLMSVGVGVELQVKSNFNLRMDYGITLEEVENPDGSTSDDDTDSRFHILATFSY